MDFNEDRPLRIIMTAAHGASNSEKVPLGGGAAICERLCRAWCSRPDVSLKLLAPGSVAPQGVEFKQIDVLQGQSPQTLNEFKYAAFCRQFENALTQEILACKPDIVLTHDIAEAPTFALLERFGIPCVPILHVDVVDFFCRMYLKSAVSPQTAERFMKRWRAFPLLPDIVRLVFDKQAEAARFCPHLVVPSQGMADVLRATYPDMYAHKPAVIPWGAPLCPYSEEEIDRAVAQLERRHAIRPQDPVLCTLSRLSPEKGIDKLLLALHRGEMLKETPPGLTLLICGEAAYMQGQVFMRSLRQCARSLKKTRVIFAGHLGGVDKAAALRRADLFVSASRHESYGLTTMEALSQGTPALASDTYGSRQTIDNSCGVLIPQDHSFVPSLWRQIHLLLNSPDYRAKLCLGAHQMALQHPAAWAADTLLNILKHDASQAQG